MSNFCEVVIAEIASLLSGVADSEEVCNNPFTNQEKGTNELKNEGIDLDYW